jgi:EmrB/QacA subfamily drug resistance transporter
MFSCVNVALPSIQIRFSANAVLLSWVVMGYMLAAAVSMIPIGRLGDIHGRKKIFLIGAALFALTTLLAGLASSIHMLISMRILQGIFNSMKMVTSMAIITSAFPAGERGKAIGIVTGSVYAGHSSGPFIGGLITQYLGWNYIFLLTAPFAVIIFICALNMLKNERAEAMGEKMDLAGCALYGVSLILFIYGSSLLPQLKAVWLIAPGLAGMVVFILWERRVTKPIFDMVLFTKNRVFAFSSIAVLISYASVSAVAFLFSLYLQFIKGLSPGTAGGVLLCQPIVQILFAPLAGRLSDRIEPGIIASAGMAVTALSLFFFVFISPATPVYSIVLTLMLLGLGYSLFAAPNANAIMSSVESRHYGIASGMTSTMRLLGMVTSIAFATVLLSFFVGRVEITPDKYPELLKSVKTAFAIFSIVCAGGIYFSLARGRVR